VDGGAPSLPYNFHALRHAAASLMIEQGWWQNPKKLQRVMGHSSIQVTFDIYGHLFPSAEDDQQDMADLEARLLS
jgi:integrase